MRKDDLHQVLQPTGASEIMVNTDARLDKQSKDEGERSWSIVFCWVKKWYLTNCHLNASLVSVTTAPGGLSHSLVCLRGDDVHPRVKIPTEAPVRHHLGEEGCVGC